MKSEMKNDPGTVQQVMASTDDVFCGSVGGLGAHSKRCGHGLHESGTDMRKRASSPRRIVRSIAIWAPLVAGIAAAIPAQAQYFNDQTRKPGVSNPVPSGNSADAGITRQEIIDRIRVGNFVIFPNNQTIGTPLGVALGNDNASISGSVTLGSNNKAGSSISAGVALGNYNYATDSLTSSIGYANRATAVSALAFGTANTASGNTAMSFGRQSTASGDYSMALGNVAQSTANNAIALGNSATASANRAIAIGGSASGTAQWDSATASRASADDAIALGAQTWVTSSAVGGVAIGRGSSVSALQGMALGSGARVMHANSVALGAGSATTVGAQSGYNAAYVGTSNSTGEINVGGRTATGVAPGIAGTDAVNVNQLKAGVNAANTYTDAQIGTVNTRIDNLDNRVSTIEGDVTTIKGDVSNLDSRVTTVEGSVTQIGNTINQFDSRVTSVENGASGMFQVSQDHNTAPRPTGANSAAGGAGAVASGNNALSMGNDSQASGNNSTALGNGSQATGAGSVAVGQGTSASHDNSVALGAGSATTIGAQSGYNAAYVGSSTSTGEVNVGSRTISGVAPGIAGTDAVNVNQLSSGVNYAVSQANQYTDRRINQMQNDVWNIDRGYRGATASAMAMAGLPQAYLPGKSMLAVGFGGYQSEYGMAVGLSGITENGRYVYKMQASGNTVRDWGFSVGAGLQW